MWGGCTLRLEDHSLAKSDFFMALHQTEESLKAVDGNILAQLELSAKSVEEQMAGLQDQLTTEISSSWKIVNENDEKVLHCLGCHSR